MCVGCLPRSITNGQVTYSQGKSNGVYKKTPSQLLHVTMAIIKMVVCLGEHVRVMEIGMEEPYNVKKVNRNICHYWI